MKITKNKFYVNPEDFFQDTDEDALSTSIDEYLVKVEDYPKDELPGAVYFRWFNYQDKSIQQKNELPIAYPKNSHCYIKPVPHQILKVEEFQGYYFYTGLYQHTQNENGDFVFDILTENEAGTKDLPDKGKYNDRMNGNISPNQKGNYDLKGFKQKEINPINEKSGDNIIKGLQNNDIILSYDKENNPLISLVLDREDKNYNQNTKGIHIYSNYDIDTDKEYAGDIKRNLPDNEKSGGGIVLNNDKIRVNANNGSIYFSTSKEFSVSANSNVNFDTKQNFNINAKEIYLGKNAKESIVLGNTLKGLMEELINEIKKIKVATANGTSSPPLNTPKFEIIKKKLDRFLSDQNKTL